jgi:hypothetical protein
MSTCICKATYKTPSVAGNFWVPGERLFVMGAVVDDDVIYAMVREAKPGALLVSTEWLEEEMLTNG